MQIGSWNIGRASTPEPQVKAIAPVKEKGGFLGGFLQWKNANLTGNTVISDKLLKANKGWVYRNNDVIATAVSELEPQLFKMKVSSGKIDFEEVQQHPILDLLDRFNDSTNKSEGFYLTQSHVKLAGDAFWLILDGEDNLPRYIFLLQPDKVAIKLGDFTDVTATLIDGYEYKDTINDGGKNIEILEQYKPDEIIHFKVPNPGNMFRGKSAVEALADEIDTDNFATEVQKNFFANGAIVDFVLSTDSKVTAEQREVLQRELRANFGGFRNAFKTLILGGGLKPERLMFSNKEMDLIALQEWFRDKIMVGFGNTKASLGLIDDVNRASHESSIIAWRQDSVAPQMGRMVDTLNEYLVPRYGDDLILGFKDPIPENRTAKVDEAVKLKAGDIINQNEARESLGYDTVDGGDEFGRERAQNQANEFIANLPKGLKYVNVKSHLRRTDFIHKAEQGREIYKASLKTAKAILENKKRKNVPVDTKPRHEQFTDEQVLAYWEKQITVTEMIELRFLQACETFIYELEQEAVGNMQTALKTKAAKNDLIDKDNAKNKAEALFRPLLVEALISAGNQANNLIDVDAPFILTSALDKYVRTQVSKFAGSVVDTDEERMAKIIVDGIKEGRSIPQIEKEMRDTFELLRKMQSERITRTEVLRATNHASVVAFEDSGVVVAKQWLTAGATDECAKYEGMVVELRDGFYKSEGEFQDGNPPIHPNCRCVVLPIVEGAKNFDGSKLYEIRQLKAKIAELEGSISDMDKRTKEYKQKSETMTEYVAALEELVND